MIFWGKSHETLAVTINLQLNGFVGEKVVRFKLEKPRLFLQSFRKQRIKLATGGKKKKRFIINFLNAKPIKCDENLRNVQ